MKYIQSFEAVNEAKRGVIHKAAKQGSYPAVVVVVQDGKVIHQEPVSTPDIAPATFNVMQEKYPKALLHLEDKTGKRLFTESVVTEGEDTIGGLNKMANTDLERIADYADMIKDRMSQGQTLDAWMYSKISDSVKNLNSVHDTMDGNDGVTEAKGGQIMTGDYVKTQYGDIYLRVDGKVGKADAYVRVIKGKAGKRKTGLHDSMKLTLVNKDGLEESVVNEAEKYITDEYKVGDKIKTDFGEWEVIETDYAPRKSFMAPFIFKGKDMKRVNIPNPPKTNKNAVGYKVTDGDKYPIIGFLYQYKGRLVGQDITKLATVGVDESVVTEAKDDYTARYKDTNINLKKAYKHLNDEQLNQLYLEIGELISDKKLKVKDVTVAFESVVTEAMDLNDPVLVAFRRTRAIMELPKFKSAEVKSRRISFNKYMDLLDSQTDINVDIANYVDIMAQTLRDMEQEAEPEGGAIADKYGSIMMKQEKEYAQLKAKKAKIDARIETYKMS